MVRSANENETEILVDEHLLDRGWSIADFGNLDSDVSPSEYVKHPAWVRRG